MITETYHNAQFCYAMSITTTGLKNHYISQSFNSV